MTVDAPARLTAAWSWALPGRETGPADAGASWAKTGGKPSAERKPCTREKTEGGAGSTESTDRRIVDWEMAELRANDELLTRVLATSQAASRVADDRHHHPEGGVDRPEDAPVDPAEGDGPDHPAGRGHQHSDAEHGDEGDEGAGGLIVRPAHGERRQQGAQEEADDEAPVGEDLHDGSEPEAVDGREEHQHDDHQVDDVHVDGACVGDARRRPWVRSTGVTGVTGVTRVTGIPRGVTQPR